MVNPFWRIWVDWNGNAVWDESIGDYREDVTGDVLELGWRWGQPVNPSRGYDHPEPAELNLTLGNADRSYSPGNLDSPLAGKLAAGKSVWAAFSYPHDDFAGAVGTDLKGRAVATGEGQAWVKEAGSAAGLALRDGRARPTAGAGGAIYTLDFGVADAQIGFIYRRSGNGVSGLVLRFVNRWDYLRVRFGDSGTLLEDVTFGFPSTLRRGDPLLTGRDYYVEIELHGSSVRLYATDLFDGTMTRQEILDGGGNAGNLTATRHGIWHDGSVAAAADRYGSFGGWRSFFYGSITRLTPEWDGDLGWVCRCTAQDALAALARRPLYNLVTGRNLSTGAIANSILTWAGFDANSRHIDSGRTLVGTEPRAVWQTGAGSALGALAEEENGRIYLDGLGYFRLEAAAHRQAAVHTASRGTLRDTSSHGPYFSHLVWDEGIEGMENSVTFRYRVASDQGLQEIWRLGDVPAVPVGQSRDFLAESNTYAAIDSILTPEAATDYTAHSRSDGTGTDLTDSLTVSLPYVGDATEASSAKVYRGRGTVVRVTNGHATATAWLTRLRLRAEDTYGALEPTSYRAENETSQTSYGLRPGVVECRYIDNYDAARQGAESRLTQRGSPGPRLALTIHNGSGKNVAEMVHRVLSDRVQVICGNPKLEDAFFIERMELSAVARTGQVAARWRLERA